MDTISPIMLKLKKKYKSGSTTEILQEAILSGDLPEGIIITQNELAMSLGTSRMPVREALIALEYQGLIERMPGQHVRVPELNDECIRSVFADMAMIETDILRNLPAEKLFFLSSCGGQAEFHRALLETVKAPMRRKFITTITEVYLSFVRANSENAGRIDAVFANILEALREPADFDVIRAGYAVYSEVLSGELIRIRKRRKSHAESKAG